jgi:Holliday junction resolvase RusA-like endonuclease
MKELANFTIAGLPPSTNNMHGYGRKGVVYLQKEVREYQKKMMRTLRVRPQISEPVILVVEFHMRTVQKYKRRDTDNAIKVLQDGLAIAGQIKNDNKVIFLGAMKVLDTKNYVRGWIYEMPEKVESIFEIFSRFGNAAGNRTLQ